MTHMTDTFCFLTRIPKLYNRVPGKAWNASRQSYESHRPYRKRRRKYTPGFLILLMSILLTLMLLLSNS